MGSCAAPSAKGDDKFITTDYLQQCPMWFIYRGPSGMVAGEAIIISITGGFLFGLLTASFHWWRRKVNRLPPWGDV
ncbi:hypothetical protein AFM75_001893 [Escherichia coli]|nr:hypothetical protein [Escherichia coli]